MGKIKFTEDFSRDMSSYLTAKDTISEKIYCEALRLLTEASKAHPMSKITFCDSMGSIHMEIGPDFVCFPSDPSWGNTGFPAVDDFMNWHGRVTMVAGEDVPQMYITIQNGSILVH